MLASDVMQVYNLFINDSFQSTTTTVADVDGSTLADTRLRAFGDRRLIGQFVRITSGANVNEVRTIINNTNATGVLTLDHPLPAQVLDGVTYEIHRYAPLQKALSLAEARYDITDDVYKLVYDETITGDGRSSTFDVPDGLRFGPVTAYIEQPIAAMNQQWNFLTSAEGDSLTGWSIQNGTASIVANEFYDLVIPKYGSSATSILADIAGMSYTQVYTDMNGLNVSTIAGRQMTFAAWVYCEVPEVVYVSLDDGVEAVTSTFHQGRGWELLSASGTMADVPSTALTVGIHTQATADPVMLAWNRAWLYFGSPNRVAECYDRQVFGTVNQDYEKHTVQLSRVPDRGRQLRLVGQAPITAFPTDPEQWPVTDIEVDDMSSRLLSAYAAQLLFEWEGVKTADIAPIVQRIGIIQQRYARNRKAGQKIPRRGLVSPYWE